MNEWVNIKHFGKVKLSLNGKKDLKFGDPDFNKNESSTFFNNDPKKNRLLFRLHLETLSKHHGAKNFFIYFVDQKKIEGIKRGYGFSGNKDFRISLEKDNEYIFWSAERDAIDNFVNKYWVAAETIILVCSDENTPLMCLDGTPLHYNIQLEYKDFYKDLFEYVKLNLKPKSYENITSYFTSFEKIIEFASENNTNKERMLFYRINDFIEPFIDLSKSIIFDPYKHLEKNIIHKSILDLSFTQTQLSSDYITSFSQTGIINHNRILPEEISFYELNHSDSSKENMFVKNGLFKILNRIEQVTSSIKIYISELDQIVSDSCKRRNDYNHEIINGNKRNQEEHEIVVNYLEDFCFELSGMLNSFLPDYHPLEEDISIQHFSEIINYDSRYSLFNQYILLFTTLLDYMNDTNDVHAFNIIPFNQMYELWVFLFFVTTLKELGFIIRNEDETLSFYNNPRPNYCYNLHHEKFLNKEFKLYFNKIFPKQKLNRGNKQVSYGLADSNNGYSYYEDLRRTGLSESHAKFSPDICLEIIDSKNNCHPNIFILDPTLGQSDSILKSKHEYSKSIRCFNCSERIGNRTESKKIVGAAWAVYPDNTYNNNIEKMDNSYSNGYVKLNHKFESQDSFRNLIVEILFDQFNLKLK
ncbi:MAG: hypothetical protein H6609_16970 [Ignavibacteriales bacterium]|nr:hypothetical protein [Ignavibacteriales bacterium]